MLAVSTNVLAAGPIRVQETLGVQFETIDAPGYTLIKATNKSLYEVCAQVVLTAGTGQSQLRIVKLLPNESETVGVLFPAGGSQFKYWFHVRRLHTGDRHCGPKPRTR